MKKKIIIVFLVLIILGSILININLLSNKEKEEEKNQIEGIELVEDKNVLKDSKIENLDITDISIVTRDEISTYNASITNNTDDEIKFDKLYAVFHEDETTNEIIIASDFTLEPNESKSISIESEINLSKTTKIEYVVKKEEVE